MFITPGELPLEPVWSVWLGAAERLVPGSYADVDSKALMGGGGAKPEPRTDVLPGSGRARYRDQALFSFYVHASPNHTGYAAESVFGGREIPRRTQVGTPSPATASSGVQLYELPFHLHWLTLLVVCNKYEEGCPSEALHLRHCATSSRRRRRVSSHHTD
jgi:hypothetical protein